MAVYKEKNGTWKSVFRGTTSRGYKTKALALQYEARVRLNEEDPTIGISFHDLALDYVEHKKPRVADSTYTKIKSNIENHILPNTVNKQISNITKNDAKKFDNYVRSLDFATRTKRFIMKQYKAIFKYSEMFYDNKNNPTVVLEPIKYSDEEILDKAENPHTIWDLDEFSDFIQYVPNENYKTLFYILYFTGFRQGEALALTWNDFKDGMLSINKALIKASKKKSDGKGYLIVPPKNKTSIRTIETGEFLNKILLLHQQKAMNKDNYTSDQFILGGKIPLKHTTLYNQKKVAYEKAGLHSIKTHDFRHSHASNLISAGVPITAVSRRLGHSNITTTLNTYTHLLKDDNIVLVGKLNESTKGLEIE